jgi:hypothetical protein
MPILEGAASGYGLEIVHALEEVIGSTAIY